MQVSSYYPPHVGGVEFVTRNLARHLVDQGVPVTVLTSRLGLTGRADGADDAADAGVAVRRLAAVEVAHTALIPALPVALWRAAKDAVVHVHLGHVYSDVVAGVVAVLRRRPLVCHFHMDVPASGPLGRFLQLYKTLVLGRLLRRADAVVTLSPEQRSLVVDRYRVRPARVTVLPNGIADEFYAAATEARPPGPLRLLFVGRLARQKNVPLLLDVVERLGDEVRLDLVGDGELAAAVTARASGLSQVTMWGPLSGADLVRRYREADLFILTSDREGMPLALLEAMAAGLPVVASDVDGLREFVRDVGRLVPAGDADGFARTIRELGADEQLRRRLAAASRAAAEPRRWSPLVRRLVEAYAQIAPDLEVPGTVPDLDVPGDDPGTRSGDGNVGG